MKPETRIKIEERLKYYNDLGIPHFYRDRAPMMRPATSESSAKARSDQQFAEEALTPTPMFKPAVLSPQAAAPSLFEARIENDTLARIQADIGEDCRRCKLCKKRKTIVFGEGNPNAELVFVGEGPGADEDEQGRPFVGRAGKLLTDMIEKGMGLKRSDVYICNVVKCRPPDNRVPEKDEVAECLPFLLRQIAVLKPKVVVALGASAMQALLGPTPGITKVHGEWFDWQGTKLMPIYHPAYLLRNPPAKPDAWKDLQKVMAYLGIPLPRKPG